MCPSRSHRLVSILTGCYLLVTATHAGAQSFGPTPFSYFLIKTEAELAKLTYSDAAWGDQDLDGDLDLLLTGLNGLRQPFSNVYINEGEQVVVSDFDTTRFHSYVFAPDGIENVWMGRASWIDLDNDGRLDPIVSGATRSERPFEPITRIYRHVENDRYLPVTVLDLDGVFGGSIDWGDYDNDGDPDLLLTGQAEDRIVTTLYENTAGRLADSGVSLPLTSLGEAKFGDFDGDGDLDILLSAVHTPTGLGTKLYRNDRGVFSEVDSPFLGLGFSSVDWGDYDNDGDLDVLLSGGVLSPLVAEERSRVYRNDGGGVFTDIGAAILDAVFGTARWADIDNDGLLDIAISGGPGISGLPFTRLHRNEGDDTFVAASDLAGFRFGHLAIGDYDADGDLDVVTTGSELTLQYRNDQRRVNNPPTAPTGLRAEKSDGGVILAWDPATDPETEAPGLTYNIRIGTAPASIDITSPMSDVETGRRLISDMGNVQNNTSWAIWDLPAGTYYWSVQAIDNAFIGSPWAEETTFEITGSDKSLLAGRSDELPGDLELLGAYPNPFDPERRSAVIEYSITHPQHIGITAYSTLGSRIATLADGYVGAGRHYVKWDGRSEGGDVVGAGIYFLRLVGEHGARTVRLVRVES